MLPPRISEVCEITFLVSPVTSFVICNYSETNGITRLDTIFFIETLFLSSGHFTPSQIVQLSERS